MRMQEVVSPADKAEFLQFPLSIYKGVKAWIQPLNQDVESVFDPAKNKTFKHGECARWLLKNDQGTTIGRIAAFVNQKNALKGNDQPTGGIGFFECLEDKHAAFFMFNYCKEWLQQRGMEAMDGPINFGSRDRWWGLLVDGFEREPNYQCNYNPPYYKDFFEAYGFKEYFKQFTYARKTIEPLSPKLAHKAELIGKDPDYQFRYLQKNEIPKLGEYIREVYNKAWANRAENPEITAQQAALIVKQMKPILDNKLLFFGFYKGTPVGFFLSLPEINQIFRYVNGNLNWWGKLKFVFYRWRKVNTKAFGILFGVVPDHQGKGVDGAMIEAARVLWQGDYKRYEDYEMNWIGDFNPKMINVVEQVGGFVSKTHITYRKLFDETKPFVRHPILK
jgi:GNAT superfamily N-acetyltransferase